MLFRSTNDQKLFDFGNSENEHFYLTPRSSDGQKLRFGIKSGNVEETIEVTQSLFWKWVHVAVTLDNNKASLYVNGVLAANSDQFTLKPMDIMGSLNYIGRSQAGDNFFNGRIDDFRVYNYALSPEEVAALADSELVNDIAVQSATRQGLSISASASQDVLYVGLPRPE